MTETIEISELKRALRIYGDHKRVCAWRVWNEERRLRWLNHQSPEPETECDCGWLEALTVACGTDDTRLPRIPAGQGSDDN